MIKLHLAFVYLLAVCKGYRQNTTGNVSETHSIHKDFIATHKSHIKGDA